MATVEAPVGAAKEGGSRSIVTFTKLDLSSDLVYADKRDLRDAFSVTFGLSYFTRSHFSAYIKTKKIRTAEVDLLCVQDMMASDSIMSFWTRNAKTQGLHADLVAAIGAFPPYPVGLGGGLVIPNAAKSTPLYHRPPEMERSRKQPSPHLEDIRNRLKSYLSPQRWNLYKLALG